MVRTWSNGSYLRSTRVGSSASWYVWERTIVWVYWPPGGTAARDVTWLDEFGVLMLNWVHLIFTDFEFNSWTTRSPWPRSPCYRSACAIQRHRYYYYYYYYYFTCSYLLNSLVLSFSLILSHSVTFESFIFIRVDFFYICISVFCHHGSSNESDVCDSRLKWRHLYEM